MTPLAGEVKDQGSLSRQCAAQGPTNHLHVLNIRTALGKCSYNLHALADLR